MSGRRGIQMGIVINNLVNESKETDKKMSEIKMLMQKELLLESKQILGLNEFSSE